MSRSRSLSRLLLKGRIHDWLRQGRSALSGRGDRDRLLFLAFHDPLTGLPNRALFIERLSRALARTGGQHHAVLFLDLDRFKPVNDRLGHTAGDELLVAVGQRLLAHLRAGDTAARLGGDEFVILLEDLVSPSDAMDTAARIIGSFRQPFTPSGRDVTVSTSIGVALSTPGHVWPVELLRDADVALYQAKAAGRGRAALFEAAVSARGSRPMLEIDLREAVERGELLLHYQPEVDLTTGAFTAVEALVRWQHPRWGMLGPVDLIPIAEDSGLIMEVGAWVLDEAARQAHRWRTQWPYRPRFVMGVNLSPRQFDHPDLAGVVGETLRRTGLEPACLRLEVTESMMMRNMGATQRTLADLKALGVGLAIDDFGVGYSSLGQLRRLNADVLKLDYSFIQDLERDERSAAIVQTVIQLGGVLGMEVVAEGIETREQVDLLLKSGCRRGQGYYFSKPLSAGELTEILRAQA